MYIKLKVPVGFSTKRTSPKHNQIVNNEKRERERERLLKEQQKSFLVVKRMLIGVSENF
jgi:hypothetical protein